MEKIKIISINYNNLEIRLKTDSNGNFWLSVNDITLLYSKSNRTLYRVISDIKKDEGKKAIFAENENHYENESHKNTAIYNVKILSYFDEIFSVKMKPI